MFTVRVELRRGEDRRGRGATVGEAVEAVGPLPAREVERVRIAWDGGREEGEGGTIQEAMERFITAATATIIRKGGL